ncbi:acyltransferase family protein, partial [uncultured Sphingomonas sp.]|uniref:acyltransferase family protein n=1 Tax=uncultured Sphingomonas sp. TaxID=158754 RepID=UPI0025FD6452
MKLFIIISGYFLALQAARIGAKAVTKDRIRRLGVPILVFLLIFNPITIYIWNSREDNYPEMYFYIFNMPDPHLDTHGAGWHLHIW